MKYNKSHFEDPKHLYCVSDLVSLDPNNTSFYTSNGGHFKNPSFFSNTIGYLLLHLFIELISENYTEFCTLYSPNSAIYKRLQHIHDAFHNLHTIHNFIFSNFPSTFHIKELLIF